MAKISECDDEAQMAPNRSDPWAHQYCIIVQINFWGHVLGKVDGLKTTWGNVLYCY